MDLSAGRRRVQKTIVSDNLSELYPHDLNLYLMPPLNQIQLYEFEEIAIDRVKLFRILEQAGLKGHTPFSDDWRACIKEDLAKSPHLKQFARLLSGTRNNTEQDYQARRIDHISHFILRVTYCRAEDLRRWFLNRELEWFRLKFAAQTHESIREFLAINKLTYTPISREEKDVLREDIICSTVGLSPYVFESTEFYKVWFTDVCSLVRARKVFLKQGFAYIPENELVVSIQSKFRAHLSEQLNIYYKRLPLMDDDRITGLLDNLHNVHIGNNYYKPKTDTAVSPADLDNYSKRHYPLCMKHIHDQLRTNHHLKHQCRLQYGLFLKAIGLIYEDALAFWREEFTRIMDENKFEKEHVYNIKHMYGKVGRMMNYASYSCIKIIMGNVGPGEHHGCPFKHWDPTIIKQQCMENGITSEGANAIKELAANGHYQIACTKYFEYSHKKPPTNGINHPNQYVEESLNLEKEKNETNKK